jgi:hypothetical protein
MSPIMYIVKKRACATTLCALTVLVFGLGAGCNRGDGPMTEQKFCEEYARIECSKVAAFCSFNPANCEPSRLSICIATARTLKSGGHQFNPGNTDRCLKKLEEAYRVLPISAAMLKDVDDQCTRVFEGTAKPAEACVADYDCADGLICDKGRCGALKVVASGAGCANIGEVCPKGEYCTANSGIFLCTRRQQQGMACSPAQPCVENLRCRDTCVPRLDIQDMCSSDDDCLSGYCNRYVTTRTCGLGLTFSPESPSCVYYMRGDDGGVPMRGPTPAPDAGADASSTD